MKRNLFFLVLLFLLNNSFNKVYGQTELITNGTFSSVSSWAFAYNNIPNSSGPVRIYLNPTKNTLKILSDKNIKSYRIFDQTGKLIISSCLLKGNQQELDASFIKTGVYIISIGTEEETINKKFIK